MGPCCCRRGCRQRGDGCGGLRGWRPPSLSVHQSHSPKSSTDPKRGDFTPSPPVSPSPQRGCCPRCSLGIAPHPQQIAIASPPQGRPRPTWGSQSHRCPSRPSLGCQGVKAEQGGGVVLPSSSIPLVSTPKQGDKTPRCSAGAAVWSWQCCSRFLPTYGR